MIAKIRQEQKLQTAALLCDAGAKLFIANGVEKTSIQEITTLAGVSVGSFYTHFETKYALLEHLLVSFSKDLKEFVSDQLAEKRFDSLEEAVRTHFMAVFSYHADHPQLSILWTGYKSYISQETSRLVDAEVEDHLRNLYKEHFYKTDLDHEIAVQATIGLAHYLMTWWNLDRDRMDLETLVEYMVGIALNGLHSHPRRLEVVAAPHASSDANRAENVRPKSRSALGDEAL